MAVTPTRTGLRKREAPTTVLVMHRNALISRVTKRQRTISQTSDTVKDELASQEIVQASEDDSESDTDEDYDERRAAKRFARSRANTAAHTRKHAPTQITNDKALTFLQNARENKIPVRSGKWNDGEENYLRKLVHLFNGGLLDKVETKMSMRSWLSKMLNCCPMRISKKQMHGEKFKGKAKYARHHERIERMAQKEYEKMCHDVEFLRSNFLKHWAKEEFGRWTGENHHTGFEKWFENIVRHVPKPTIAKNDRLVEVTANQPVQEWASIQKEIGQADKTTRKGSQARDAASGAATAPFDMKVDPSSQSQVNASCSDGGKQSECQGPCCSLALLDMPFSLDSDVCSLEPTPSPLMELDIGISALDWEHCAEALSKPTAPRLFGEELLPQLSPSIVLDFGPPSLWNVDPIVKDNTSPSSGAWVDDFIADDSLLAFDPALASPGDFSSGIWFQQLCSTFQL